MPSEIIEAISFPTASDNGLGPIGLAADNQMVCSNRALGVSYKKNLSIALGGLLYKNIQKGSQYSSPKMNDASLSINLKFDPSLRVLKSLDCSNFIQFLLMSVKS